MSLSITPVLIDTHTGIGFATTVLRHLDGSAHHYLPDATGAANLSTFNWEHWPRENGIAAGEKQKASKQTRLARRIR